jgi:transcription termination factor Rho
MPPAMDLNELKKKSLAELTAQANALSVDSGSLKKPELISAIIKAQAKSKGDIYASGTLEILPDGFGFLRAAADSFLPGPEDVYVSPSQIRRFRLHTGDSVRGLVRPPKESERYFALLRVESVNDQPAEGERSRPSFSDAAAIHPKQKLNLEGNHWARALDLFAPLGRGQRAIVHAPPRAGLTRLFRSVAEAVRDAHDDVKCMAVLVDQRPEEIFALKSELGIDLVASSFDESPARHAQVADIVVENAKRLAESGKDVLLFIDSLTKLARAYSAEHADTAAGELHPEALTRCKKLLGAGRNLQGGGSVTLLAALRESDSPLDRFLAVELSAAANCEIVLAFNELGLDTARSRTHRDDLLRSAEAIAAVDALRGEGHLSKARLALEKSATNEQLLASAGKK